MFLVLDPEDSPAHTALVNGLADLQRGRVVVHAPPAPARRVLAESVLRAIGRDLGERLTPATAERCAAAYLAEQRYELIVYGAWRLTAPTLRWLASLEAPGATRVWLITHTAAHNLPLLTATATETYSLQLFQQQLPRHPRTKPPAQHPSITIVESGRYEDRLLPFPWLLSSIRDRTDRDVALLLYQRVREVLGPWSGKGGTRALARLLLRLLSDHGQPAARRLILAAAQDVLFRSGAWLDADTETLVTLPAGPCESGRDWIVEQVLRQRHPHTALALAVAYVTDDVVRRDDEVSIAPDGSQMLDIDGNTAQVPPALQPTVRAALRLPFPRMADDPPLRKRIAAAQITKLERFSGRHGRLAQVAAAITVQRLTIVGSSPVPLPTTETPGVQDDGAKLASLLMRHDRYVSDRQLAEALGWHSDRVRTALDAVEHRAPLLGLGLHRVNGDVALHHRVDQPPAQRGEPYRPLHYTEAAVLYQLWRAASHSWLQTAVGPAGGFPATAADAGLALDRLRSLQLIDGEIGRERLTSWVDATLRYDRTGPLPQRC